MDAYTILGVPPGASAEEVAAAYRELAKQWHPDRGGGDEAARRMAEINAAYDILRAGAAHGAPPPPEPPAAPARARGFRTPCGARSGRSCSRRWPSARRSAW